MIKGNIYIQYNNSNDSNHLLKDNYAEIESSFL